MSLTPIPCDIGIAPYGYTFVGGVLVKGEHGSLTKAQSLKVAEQLRESEQAKTSCGGLAACPSKSVRASTPWVHASAAVRSWPFISKAFTQGGIVDVAGAERATAAMAHEVPPVGNTGGSFRSVFDV